MRPDALTRPEQALLTLQKPTSPSAEPPAAFRMRSAYHGRHTDLVIGGAGCGVPGVEVAPSITSSSALSVLALADDIEGRVR
jgi:hypothetical protein